MKRSMLWGWSASLALHGLVAGTVVSLATRKPAAPPSAALSTAPAGVAVTRVLLRAAGRTVPGGREGARPVAEGAAHSEHVQGAAQRTHVASSVQRSSTPPAANGEKVPVQRDPVQPVAAEGAATPHAANGGMDPAQHDPVPPAPVEDRSVPLGANAALARREPASARGGLPPLGGSGGEGSVSSSAGATAGRSGEGSEGEARGEGGSPSLIGELHRRLAAAARSCYPPAARRFALRGAVKLAFSLGPQGEATSSELKGTTGSALLDRAAISCVLPRAAPLPPLPGHYVVDVRFDAQ